MARMLREFSAMPEERRTDGYAARIIDLARNGVLDAKALSDGVGSESKAMRSL